ncbi:helix-turn-helix protein [Orbus hercynius]|uniref:Helix-turn-helix protein n=1 Tax=Orbus hercynius TaxID=593135 RepID=A0A495RJP7_9GAMM|nr:helix-turn-helix domain-containing protein [Orbus hercynius]RKS87763.1 helix-turn-helix protein [Orbus hercynius]
MKQNYFTFAQRLKYIIGDSSLLSFSKKCNLSESAIRKYIREESEPTLQNLLTMAKVGNVSVAWLATGHDPFVSNADLLPQDTKNIVVTVPEIEFNNILAFTNNTLTPLEKKSNIITEWVLSRDWLYRSGLINEDLAIVQVPYNNMANTIKCGDIAVISLAKGDLTHVLAGIYIILLNNKLLIKRIQYDPIEDGYHLINDNETFKNHLIKQNDVTPFHVLAKIDHILTNISY